MYIIAIGILVAKQM